MRHTGSGSLSDLLSLPAACTACAQRLAGATWSATRAHKQQPHRTQASNCRHSKWAGGQKHASISSPKHIKRTSVHYNANTF